MTLSRWKTAAVCAAIALGGGAARADTLLAEGFDSVAALTGAGWILTNASASPGSNWFQGNSGIFGALAGAEDAYIAANFLAASSGPLSLWLITPTLDFSSAGTLTFYTRTDGSAGYADSLKVFASSATDGSVASFTSLLYTVNPTEAADGYPSAWTQVTVSYGATGGSGRLAFVYSQSNVDNANYIGIDSVSVTAVPEPASIALLAAGLGLVGFARRRRIGAAASASF
jgi:PEP-CTERM motif-containing protein